MIRAAGILYRARSTNAVLLLQRGPNGDHPGTWAPPGGKVENDETLEQAAVRESVEEAGPKARTALKNLKLLARRVAPDECDFTTYLVEVDEPFDIVLDDESTAFTWAQPDAPPEPLHPGARVALAKLSANELEVARMMVAGDLVSPQFFANMMLLDLRITGTGVAYRPLHDEYCVRLPENYLNDEFLARCNGLPVLWEHPAKATLDSKEWADRVVGTVFLPYIRGDEVWAVGKIYDRAAIADLTNGEAWSTSPTVDFGAGLVVKNDNEVLVVENDDGTRDTVLVEGRAPLLDHVAICPKGVWDKGGEPSGVNTARADQAMADEDDKKREDVAKADQAKADQAKADQAKADKARADAEDERWGKLMDSMSSVSKIADSVEDLRKRMDAWDEEKKSDKRKDADEEARKANEAANEPGAGDDEEVERKAKADKKSDEDDEKMSDKRKDKKSDEDEDKKREDAAKADARADSLAAEVAELKRQMKARDLSDDDFNAIGAAQLRADDAYRMFGKQAPRPHAGESSLAYRRRVANELKTHSPLLKDANLARDFDSPASFEIAERGIYADALAAATSPTSVPAGELRAVRRRDTGHEITEYHGEPRAWMAQFGGYRGSVKAFRAPTDAH